MSNNTMNDKIIEVDNSISNLSFLWYGILNNNSKIYQLEINGRVHEYKEILDQQKINNLKAFILYNKNNPREKFIISIKYGLIFHNKIKRPIFEFRNKKNNVRTIYKRRIISKVLYSNLKTIERKIIYIFGCQWNDKLGKNHKTILQIDERGNFIIGE